MPVSVRSGSAAATSSLPSTPSGHRPAPCTRWPTAATPPRPGCVPTSSSPMRRSSISSVCRCRHGCEPQRLTAPHRDRAARRAPRAAGMLGHSVDTTLVEVVRHGELRVVHPVGAWCQLATDLTVRELVVLGDALVRRHDPWATREELEAAVVAFRGRGKRRLVAALELVRPRTDSPPETELRLDILEAGLPEPGVNVAIHDVHGRLI